MNTEKLLTLLFSLLATVASVLGCGVMPQGQARTSNFIVRGFRLPTAMVFTTSASAPVQLPGGIAATSDAAKSFVSRLVMQTIVDVLEQQGRSAGLPDAIISGILSQLMFQISYDPLECKTVTIYPKADKKYPGVDMNLQPHCIVIGNTVTSVCTSTEQGDDKCELGKSDKIELVAAKHMSITGSLTV
ncbi:hypothetical protein KIN20_026933 [Parelaphostrongylus tenuis]|uniref:Lipoprotein n=1 Tax=Parelaphostrongylus tenuis TaxID=148309 RepID=A0AAD5WDB0_PARTN|nr:hypothetical protein KIN20_026933 [Parelaphostrongylus tenuis]